MVNKYILQKNSINRRRLHLSNRCHAKTTNTNRRLKANQKKLFISATADAAPAWKQILKSTLPPSSKANLNVTFKCRREQ